MVAVFLKRRRLVFPVLGMLCLGCNSLFYYPSKRIYVVPEKLKIQYTDHFFKTRDGSKLHGRICLHDGGDPPRGLFVLFHGNAQNLTAHYLAFTWVLHHGYDLFVFDYAGYGKSEGEASRPSSVESGRAALRFVADSLLPAYSGQLVLVGQSLGGAILTRCLAEWGSKDKTTLAVVDAAFPSYRRIAKSDLAKHWLTWPLQPLVYLLISESESPIPFIPGIAPTPTLVTVCTEDPVNDARFSREIFALAREPKWYWEQSPCGHIQSFRIPAIQERLIRLLDSLAPKPEEMHVH